MPNMSPAPGRAEYTGMDVAAFSQLTLPEKYRLLMAAHRDGALGSCVWWTGMREADRSLLLEYNESLGQRTAPPTRGAQPPVPVALPGGAAHLGHGAAAEPAAGEAAAGDATSFAKEFRGLFDVYRGTRALGIQQQLHIQVTSRRWLRRRLAEIAAAAVLAGSDAAPPRKRTPLTPSGCAGRGAGSGACVGGAPQGNGSPGGSGGGCVAPLQLGTADDEQATPAPPAAASDSCPGTVEVRIGARDLARAFPQEVAFYEYVRRYKRVDADARAAAAAAAVAVAADVGPKQADDGGGGGGGGGGGPVEPAAAAATDTAATGTVDAGQSHKRKQPAQEWAEDDGSGGDDAGASGGGGDEGLGGGGGGDDERNPALPARRWRRLQQLHERTRMMSLGEYLHFARLRQAASFTRRKKQKSSQHQTQRKTKAPPGAPAAATAAAAATVSPSTTLVPPRGANGEAAAGGAGGHLERFRRWITPTSEMVAAAAAAFARVPGCGMATQPDRVGDRRGRVGGGKRRGGGGAYADATLPAASRRPVAPRPHLSVPQHAPPPPSLDASWPREVRVVCASDAVVQLLDFLLCDKVAALLEAVDEAPGEDEGTRAIEGHAAAARASTAASCRGGSSGGGGGGGGGGGSCHGSAHGLGERRRAAGMATRQR